MTEPDMPHADDHDACTRALGQVHAFLHGELSEQDADLIRLHLDACEKCLEDFDVEQAIARLIKRCNPPTPASGELRLRIVSMSMAMRHDED